MYRHEDLIIVGHSLSAEHGAFQVRGTELIFPDGYKPTEEECEAALLAHAEQTKLAEIDSEYEARRQSYLTAGATMAMVYYNKFIEAQAYKVDPTGTYPMLEASVKAGEAADTNAAADLILSKASQLSLIAAGLEEERLAKKIAVNSATKLKDIKGE